MSAKNFLYILMVLQCLKGLAQESNTSLTYEQVISKYKALDSLYTEAKLMLYGRTDCGKNLHLFILSATGDFDIHSIHAQKKCVLLINNGIHPGEPDGIDASVQLATDLLTRPDMKKLLKNVVVCIVPVFNIDGALERGCCVRVNQNGPEQYGFRGNAKNLDLNRDFMKDDSQNTISLLSILHGWDPDLFIDTHVSDGADYQYSMSLISSQHSKMSPPLGELMKHKITPELFKKMREKKDDMTPYVNTMDGIEVPDSGLVAFLESPRFLSGYMSLFNALPFISESHMLKPFETRKKSTYNLLLSLIEVGGEYHSKILEARAAANSYDENQKTFFFNYKLDTTKKERILFRGYEAGYKQSAVTGNMRLFYDREKPYEKEIDFYDSYFPTDSIHIPKYFIIPQAYYNYVHLLDKNSIICIRNYEDSSVNAEVTYIESYETVRSPYEGHYLHYDIKTRREKQTITIHTGDYIVPLPQKGIRFVLEALVPSSCDSYFAWGFFDSWLQQKEGFSPYVFEDIASGLISGDEQLRENYESWLKVNQHSTDYEKLNFIYQHSPYFEKSYCRYPIYSVN